MRGAKEIDKASNKFLPDAVLAALAKVQAPVKVVNDAGLKASKQMWDYVNKYYLERGSLDAVLIASMEVHAPEKGVNNTGPKELTVVQSTGNGF